MEASQNNDFAHQPGLPLEEIAKRYSSWSLEYERDLSAEIFRGPIIISQKLQELFPDRNSRTHLCIVDLAAGTGFVGEQISHLGFKTIDAVEPSQGMMEILKTKNVYNKTFLNFIDGNKLHIEQDTYDVAVVSGGMGEGHIPCKGLDEMARVVKPGGYVVIAMREAYLENVLEYKDRLEPYMAQMEKAGLWQMTSRKVIPMYSWSNNGVLFTFRIK